MSVRAEDQPAQPLADSRARIEAMEGGRPSALPSTGPAAAAILAAAIGVFVLGLCSILGDAFAPVARILDWVPRTGPLSGVTGCAVLLWLLTWWGLRRRWDARQIELPGINRLAAALFVIGLLLSFPPFMDLLQGK